MKCINTNSVEYISLQEMTGLMPYELNTLIRDYYEKHDSIPTVDKCLTIDYDTSQHLIKAYGLKKIGNQYTTINGQPIDPVEINKIYRDLEVSVTQYDFPIIDIKQRALLNRDLQTNLEETVQPTFLNNIQELVAIGNKDGKYIYQYDGKFYVSDQRLSDTKLLKNLQFFNSYDEALNSKIQVQPKGLTGNTIKNIKYNKNKLNAGHELEINSKYPLPPTFSIFENFNYPEFIINPNQQEKYKTINNVIVLNSVNNLELNLLLAQNISLETAQSIVDNLKNPIQYETIKTGNNSYVIRRTTINYDINESNLANKITISPNQSLEPLLDRLEELYGIKFNRVTNEDIRNSGLNRYVYDATQVNAFILNGQIYINMDNAKTDAPIHELSHLLLGSLRQTNPELYAQIVNSVEQYPEYQYELKKYKNRSRMDANEEIFVDLFARHYAGLLNLGIDDELMQEVEYQIERNIDSAIFPNVSTTKQSLSNLMGKSFEEIMLNFGTVITKDNIARAFDKSATSRYVANVKESLFETNALKEYCNG